MLDPIDHRRSKPTAGLSCPEHGHKIETLRLVCPYIHVQSTLGRPFTCAFFRCTSEGNFQTEVEVSLKLT